MASIKKLLLHNMLFLTFISFTCLYSFWVLNEYIKFNEESASVKEKFVTSEKERLKAQVQAVLEYVQYMRNQTEKRLRDSIKGRVNEACAIAMNIYNENKDSKSHDEIKKMIKDALRPIRFNQNRGYYFAFNMEGIEELFADRPEMEGKDMLSVQGAKGEYVVPDMIEIIKAQEEGFYSYTWSKPGELDAKYLKIAYVKYFEPYGWGIGTGEYLEDVKKEIQEEVLERISKLRFEKEGYFFGSIYGGKPLFTNGEITKKTKSVWELTDPKGVKIIQEQNSAAKEPEGGFVSYSWQKLNSEELSPKLSYVVGIPEWEWLIGAGVYLDTMDEVILSKKKTLYHDFLKQAVLYFAVMILMFFLIFLWTRYQAHKIQSGIRLFSNFFKTASSQATTIDPDGLQFEEFKSIAVSANQMIETRTEAIQALRESEEDLKESQRIAHVGSWRLDLASNRVVWSEELYRMYGFDPASPPPPYTEHQKLFTPESWNKLSTALNNTKDTGIPYELELETLGEDGNRGWLWVHGEAVRDAMGVIVGLRGAAQDITERKQTEAALKASEKKYQSLFKNAQVALFRNRLSDGKVLEINERYAKIAGYSTIEDCMAEFNAADAWVDPNGRIELLKILQKNGFVSDYETKIIRKDGTHIWISFSATIFPEQGFLEGSLVEITERKRSEIERQKLQAQLDQAQKMESVGRLAGGVAHDFNNMLTIILGNAEIIMADIDPSNPLVTNLEEIYKAAERSANLTRQLLAFARKQTIAPKILNLNHVLDDMIKMLKRLIGEDIDLTWQPAQTLWTVKIDPSQIDQILANLCVNARDAIKSVGKVTIETDNISFDEVYCKEHAGFIPGDYVMMAVSDNGSGMDKNTLDNLFEPFFTTKDIGQGTGLGLATVYGIVKQNNGFINVYSEPGEGTTFKIYLPVHSETAVPKQKDFKKTSLTGNETILLVEDEKAILRMTKMMLERLGYTVLTASAPNEAISIVEGANINAIHLLMTDVVMPEMNGRDLSKKLLSIYPGLKCLFMSGYTANVIAHHGVLDTGVQFINKPFSRQDLATKVREVLD